MSMAQIPCCCVFGIGQVAAAPIRPLAWEPPYAVGTALEKDFKKKKGNLMQLEIIILNEVSQIKINTMTSLICGI